VSCKIIHISEKRKVPSLSNKTYTQCSVQGTQSLVVCNVGYNWCLESKWIYSSTNLLPRPRLMGEGGEKYSVLCNIFDMDVPEKMEV
jgi:hypothetical protein